MGLNIQDLKVTSPDFEDGSWLDDRFASPSNTVPRLQISGVPDEAVELAVICHDPDAPLPQGFTHWVLYGLDPVDQLLDADRAAALPSGDNGTGQPGYFGPEPPPGHGPHHYYFWVYALDAKVDGTPTREQFLDAYAGNIVEQNRIVGRYQNE